jgi:hypothetical protein
LAPLRGATLERLSLEELIDKSTAIVRGRVAGSYAALRGNVIYTHYRVQISQRWKGPQGAAVEVMVPGGVAGGMRQSYSGVPRLVEGKEYVLFLWAGSSGNTQIIGYTQGVFELPKKTSGAAIAYRAASSEMMIDSSSGQAVASEPLELTLKSLTDRITARLTKETAR